MNGAADGRAPRVAVSAPPLPPNTRGGAQTDVGKHARHLGAGLRKLDSAKATVDSLSNNAEVEQAKLQEAQRGADAAMDAIIRCELRPPA